MSKTKIIAFIAVGLFVLNLALIAVLLSHSKHKRPPHQEPRTVIIERLHFDDAQIKEYDKLIQEHRNAIEEQEKNILRFKDQLYTSVSENKDSIFVNSVEQQLGLLQIGIEQIHYRHFQEIKNLCRADQKEQFIELMKNISGIFSPPRPKGRKK